MLQPFHHLHIEMVGGFVHDQQDVLMLETDIDECSRKRYAFPLASRQRAGRFAEDDVILSLPRICFHLGIEIPRAQIVHENDGIGQFIDIFRIAGRLKGLYRIDDGVVVMKDIIEDGTVFDEEWFLLEKRHRNVLVDPDGAAFRRVITRKNAEEGGFPAAVAGKRGRSYRLLRYEK